jgi:uncharacterized protein DUF4382/carboxypeptidase family protein
MIPRIFALAFLASLISCGGGGGDSNANPPGGPAPGQGTLTLLATDDPFVYEIVTSANITVDRVSVHTDANAEDNGFLVIYDGPPLVLNLLSLHDGLTTQLAHANLATGAYRQIRIHVIAADLTLTNGNTYSTAAGNLHLTSQATSGFKVFVDPPIEIEDGISRTFLLDFDLTKTFHPVPAADPLAATSYQLQPVIHAANVSTSGEIRGDVTQLSPTAPPQPVPNATVYILPAGVTDVDQSTAVTATNSAGEFAQLGLPPGTYDVRAVKGALEGTQSNVSVTAGSFTLVHILLQ